MSVPEEPMASPNAPAHVTMPLLVGASAGGIEALTALLSALPTPPPFPIVVVLHLPPQRPSLLPAIFSRKGCPAAREAAEKEPLEPGVLYFAPPDYHLLLESDLTLSLSTDAPVLFSRPSVDVLFESAAATLGRRAVAVLLSGASADGAQGLRMLQDAGAWVFIQDPQTALAREMPEAASRLCPAAPRLSPEAIAAQLMQRVSSGAIR